MRFILLSILSTFYFSNSFPQGFFWDNETDPCPDLMVPIDTFSLQTLGLKGKVKQIKSETYVVKSKGRDTEYTDPTNGCIYSYLYDDYEFAYINFDDHSVINDFTYKFDSDGRMICAYFGSIRKMYWYDEETGLLKTIRENNFDESIPEEERPEQTISIHYKNDTIAWAVFYRNHDVDHYERYKFDERYNLIEIGYRNTVSEPYTISTAKFEYDVSGQLIYKEFYCESNTPLSTRYIYDEQGNLVSETSVDYMGGSYTRDYIKEPKTQNVVGVPRYNNRGEICEWKIDSTSKEIFSYEYAYDDQNNWTSIIEYRNSEPMLIRKRIIEYYP